MVGKVTTFLVQLIEAIENVRLNESGKWDNQKHFQILQRCLQKARELLHFESTRAPTQLFSKRPKSFMDVGNVTTFLANLIDIIEWARFCESVEWEKQLHFKALDRCLDEVHGLLHFELTRAPTQQGNQPNVSPDVGQKRVTRQNEAKQSNTRIISLPDEVLNIVFSYLKDPFYYRSKLSSNAVYNFALVCKSWYRVSNRRLWQNIHLLNRKRTILFARSLHERSPLSIGDGIRELHVHCGAEIYFPASFTYVFDCVKLFTKNIVSLNLLGLSTELRPMKLTEFYEIVKLHPHLKHVSLDHIEVDSIEPLDPLPQFEKFDCRTWLGPEVVENLELISAKIIEIDKLNVFEKDVVKSASCNDLPRFEEQSYKFQQLTHVYLYHDVGIFQDDENDMIELFRSIPEIPHLSFLVLDELTFLTSSSFDLIAEHCSLTTFVIKWQPGEDSVDSWIGSIQKMGPKLLSVGVGLKRDKYGDHPNILQAIYQNCPNLMTLELYGYDPPSDSWPLDYASELENLCRLPLKWIYAPWFKKWPQKWKDSCPQFTKLCRLGLDVGLDDLSLFGCQLLDYTQSMRPALIGDGFT